MSLEPGDLFTSEANVIKSGLASVKYKNKTISIGPLSCESGTLVHVRYLGPREKNGTTTHFGVCLDESVVADRYSDYMENIRGLLTLDSPPSAGEPTPVRVADIVDGDIGIAEFGDTRVKLGPTTASVGEWIQVIGASNDCARIKYESDQGDNYEARFNLLLGNYVNLPIKTGDEFTTAITDVRDGVPIGHLRDVPVGFENSDLNKAQRVDGRITGFTDKYATAEVTNVHDEIANVADVGHWARMQWLRHLGFDEDPLREFTEEFIASNWDIEIEEDVQQIRDALIAEALRLAVADKAETSDAIHPRAHVSGIRHWVIHKLSPVLGDPDTDDNENGDWFREVLTDRQGPTVEFLGDLMELKQGYYAPSPTRAVMLDEATALLISGQPSDWFLKQGLQMRFAGISRFVLETSEAELEELGVVIQSEEEYMYDTPVQIESVSNLSKFITSRQQSSWTQDPDWQAYTGPHEYGFTFEGTDPFRTELPDGSVVSMWRSSPEYGHSEYYIRREADGEDPSMITVPRQYYKQVCLAIDAAAGMERTIEIKMSGTGPRINMPFAPPRAQMRWINAVGGQWEPPRSGTLRWGIESDYVSSAKRAFDSLPVNIQDNT